MTAALKQQRASVRFLLAYRLEVADGVGGQDVWRGWIARVPERREDAAPTGPNMHWFESLDELPQLVRALMRDMPDRALSARLP